LNQTMCQVRTRGELRRPLRVQSLRKHQRKRNPWRSQREAQRKRGPGRLRRECCQRSEGPEIGQAFQTLYRKSATVGFKWASETWVPRQCKAFQGQQLQARDRRTVAGGAGREYTELRGRVILPWS
jgi:hypothetical protein